MLAEIIIGFLLLWTVIGATAQYITFNNYGDQNPDLNDEVTFALDRASEAWPDWIVAIYCVGLCFIVGTVWPVLIPKKGRDFMADWMMRSLKALAKCR